MLNEFSRRFGFVDRFDRAREILLQILSFYVASLLGGRRQDNYYGSPYTDSILTISVLIKEKLGDTDKQSAMVL